MKKKFTFKIETIKEDLKNKFGNDEFEKIYSFYKKEEKVRKLKFLFILEY